MASPKFVKSLLAKGSDINATNKYGETALSVATKNGYHNVVEVLKARGAKN